MEKQQQLFFKLKDTPSPVQTIFFALQWALFIYSLNLIYPLVIGDVFQLPPQEITALVQRSTFLVGLGSFLQILWGHRLPIIEGVSALWFSIFILFNQAGTVTGQTPAEVLRYMEFGLIFSGIVMALFGFAGLLGSMQKLFTPLVVGLTLILTGLQVSGSFVEGMLGYENGRISVLVALSSIGVVSLVVYLSYKGNVLLKSLSALIGLMVGWGLYSLLGLGEPVTQIALSGSPVYLPQLFAWGNPQMSGAMVITAFIGALVLISNQLASLIAIQEALGEEVPAEAAKSCGIFNGISNILSGVFAGIGTIPLANSAGFIRMTGVGSRLPFLLATVILMLVGLLWPLGQFFTRIPAPVAYAVSFATFSQMIGIGFSNLARVEMNRRNLLILGLTLCTSVGLMFIPPEAYGELPVIFQTVFSNGLLMGIVVVLLLEHAVFRAKGD
ncbi:MAG: purine/pyrimidine permease [Clostridia bacterium]|nr:purine/pyrimidine permease [Clostridia bacterium]